MKGEHPTTFAADASEEESDEPSYDEDVADEEDTDLSPSDEDIESEGYEEDDSGLYDSTEASRRLCWKRF